MNKRKVNNNYAIFFIILSFVFVYGWIANIVKIIGMDDFSGFMVARVIGVFIPPIGGVLGFF